jgi:hypothetical protein
MPYSALRNKKNQLIRRARDGSVFVAAFSAPPITTLTAAGGVLQPLPAGWQDLGWTSTDGTTYGRDISSSDVTSFGSVEPTRSDITSDSMTMAVTAQETKLLSIGLYTGADTTGLKAAAGSGELSIAKPARPSARFYRLLGLFVDETEDGEIYLARSMPRAKVTEPGEQQYSDGDDPIGYPLTFTGYEDSVLGYSHRWIFGGPGWLALLADMAIEQATT